LQNRPNSEAVFLQAEFASGCPTNSVELAAKKLTNEEVHDDCKHDWQDKELRKLQHSE